MRGIRWVAAVGLAGGLFVGAAFAQGAATQTVTDERGEKVEVPAKPQRVASISYLGADVALALGIMPVGSTYMLPGRNPDFLLGLTKKMKVLGQRAQPNLELVSAAKPDIIIAIKRYTLGNADLLQKIAPYVAYNNELLSESYAEVAQIAKILGQPKRGEKLNADFKAHLQEFAAKAPKGKRPSFVIMWAGGSPSGFHNENTAASIMVAIGGKNVLGPMATGGRFNSPFSLETLLEKDPDVILAMEWEVGSDGKSVRSQESNPIWQNLSAVKNGRVFYVGDHWAEANGPIAREVVLREAAHYLYPDTFPAANIRGEAAKLIPADLQK